MGAEEEGRERKREAERHRYKQMAEAVANSAF